MKKSLLIRLLILFVIIFVSCSPLLEDVDTATPTSSPTPTALPTSKLIPTWTPPPTLSYEAVEMSVINLLEDTTNCELPCWWGIIPGSSNWQEAKSILQQFAISTNRFYDDGPLGGYVSIYIDSLGLNINISYRTEDNIIKTLFITTERLDRIEDGFIRIFNDPYYYELFGNYTLESILSTLGQPEEIRIKSFNENPQGWPTYSQLYYPEFGVVMEYKSGSGWRQDDDGEWWVVTCPTRSFISLRLFNPNAGLTFSEMLEKGDNPSLYLDLEVATGMTNEEFFINYQTSDCNIELETPANLWPSEFDITK